MKKLETSTNAPKFELYLCPEDGDFRLEFDGLADTKKMYQLSAIGCEMAIHSLIQLPIFVSFSRFWGYKDAPVDEAIKISTPKKGDTYLSFDCYDEMPLTAVANILKHPKCWEEFTHDT